MVQKKLILDSRIPKKLLYDPEEGYGFVFPDGTVRDEEKRDSLPGEYSVPPVPSFIVDVPDGNYKVCINGSMAGDKMDLAIRTGPGHLNRRIVQAEREECFAVHVCDEKLKIAFIGNQPFSGSLEITSAPEVPTLFLAGDSTVTDQSSSQLPFCGWGQMLPFYLPEDVAVSNHAMSGRSSKSFIEEGRLERIWNRIHENDFLFIQFGHNDEKDNEGGTRPFSTYQDYLNIYIEGARKRGAFPVLISPMHRRLFDEQGNIINTHGDYLAAMEELSLREKVPYIDLAGKSKTLYEKLGEEGTKKLFMWADPGDYAKYPEGIQDNTHFQESGALEIAKLVAEGMKEHKLEPFSALRGY
ncbi:rhamnogalacturonan acetylesterase [Mesobacillus foraminis]|uniref:rhamnogalacturonan acetylesterase n=1 Tax=Mesobacillus foraminis TaxID=279826 RepID=UPI0039A0F934